MVLLLSFRPSKQDITHTKILMSSNINAHFASLEKFFHYLSTVFRFTKVERQVFVLHHMLNLLSHCECE